MLKEIFKKNISYFIVFSILLLMTWSIFVISYYSLEPGNLNLELDKYGKIITVFMLLISIFYFFILNIAEKKKFKLENMFLLLAIPIGIIYLIAFPIGTVPDERAHFLRAYEVSLGNLVSDKTEKNEGGRVLPENLDTIIFKIGEENTENWFKRVSSEELSENEVYTWFSNTSLYAFVCYLPQALGIAISRIFTSNILIMAYTGRIFNFITFIILMYFAIKLIPFKKIMALLVAFLPIVFQEAISLAPDALTIATSMLFIGYIFHLKYTREGILKKRDYAILLILSILIALCKIIYIPICLLMYILPDDKFKSKKQKYIILTILVFIAFAINLSWLGFASGYLMEFNPNVNSKEQVKFILTKPISFIIIFIRTLIMHMYSYINNILGNLSFFNIQISDIYKYLIFSILILSIFADNSTEHEVKKSTKVIIGLSLLLVIVLLFTSLYVQWTPLKSIIIDGVQGRYLIPVLILLPFLFNNSYIILKKKISMRYFLSVMLFVNIHALTCVLMCYR